jgi:hypothetical protein
MQKENNVLKILFLMSVMISLTILCISITRANPTGPDILTRGATSNLNESHYSAKTTTAVAGNITELSVDAITMTRSWQGYYGNITGEIFLQDVNGWVFYNWTIHEPTGEVYASPNTSVSWAAIHCFNFTANAGNINLTAVESWYNITSYAADGIDATFNATNNPSFYVGSTLIANNTCPTTYINQNNASQQINFPNMLLTDNSSLVFTALIENTDASNATDKPGYNGINYDFQLLVAEDGHTDFVNPQTTTYYFWVELN